MQGRQPSVVGIANEQVPIALAARLAGVDLPDDLGGVTSWKVLCPFGDVYHADGGLEAALRIYPETNQAFCFAGCGYFTPVRLVAAAWDRPPRYVASELLERVGVRPRSLAQRWAEASQVEHHPDVSLLAEALKIYCRRACPSWEAAQFEPAVAAKLTRCLALLDRVHTDPDALTWLTASKNVMGATLQQLNLCSRTV